MRLSHHAAPQQKNPTTTNVVRAHLPTLRRRRIISNSHRNLTTNGAIGPQDSQGSSVWRKSAQSEDTVSSMFSALRRLLGPSQTDSPQAAGKGTLCKTGCNELCALASPRCWAVSFDLRSDDSATASVMQKQSRLLHVHNIWALRHMDRRSRRAPEAMSRDATLEPRQAAYMVHLLPDICGRSPVASLQMLSVCRWREDRCRNGSLALPATRCWVSD